jgi:large subunit ribosomal protein L24
MKLRTGDTVVVISGKDKGKTGTVTRVLPQDGRAIITGINMRTRHIKKTFEQAGRILKYEAAINVSKVMIIDPKMSKPSRIGFKMVDGKKMRISKLSGEVVTKAKMKKEAKKGHAKKETEVAKTNEVTDVKKTTDTAAASKGQPFWKRMKFGSAMEQQAEMPEPSNMEKDHSIPSQEIHVRKGARGS